ncbi:DUF2955 domain-containing protein [Pseudomonas akapageensis]|uniref:DUF2955 domain-containing protein n=1 Tax=Pseudomonas akapageensis TaxID=2609961 RepID=UPI00140AB71E|nr:DUF2955 domain-containing protein [Pseudomonas akapageensis]
MPTEQQVRAQRALRLATGTALCLAAAFGLALPIPFIAPILALTMLAAMNQPLPLKASLGLAVVAMLTTSTGLLLIPLLHYYAACGVMLVGLCLYLVFGYGLGGGNSLVATFMVVGLTLISAAGASDFDLALQVIGALIKGLLLAVTAVSISHWLFPDPIGAKPRAPAPDLSDDEKNWLALRAALVVMPAFLLALIDPASYMPIVMKAVNLGQQSCATNARTAGRELLGSTLLGGLMAILFWFALGMFVNLWMFFLWMLLFGLLVARKLYGLSPGNYKPGFWLNSLTTMIILLGQSVQDSAAGKDVYTAFAIRMGLFILVTLYACAMVYLLDTRRQRRRIRNTSS